MENAKLTPIEIAEKGYKAIILPYQEVSRLKGPVEAKPWAVAEAKVRKAWEAMPNGQQKKLVLYIGAAFSYHSECPRLFEELASSFEWNDEELLEIGVQWFIHHSDRFDRAGLPSFVQNDARRDLVSRILNRVLTDAPESSTKYVDAVRLLIRQDMSVPEVNRFRTSWEHISANRREAIAIALSRDHMIRNHFDHGLIVLDAVPTRLDLLTLTTSQATGSRARPKWIDRRIPFIRGQVWQCFSSASEDFASSCASLGDERGQVSGLLENLRLSARTQSMNLQSQLRDAGVALTFDRFVFSAAEENAWGPDFALTFSYVDEHVVLQRYVLFQAKLLKDGKVKVVRRQLSSLLKSGWHSSFYVVWGAGIAPRCVPASILDSYMRVTGSNTGGRETASRTIDWQSLYRFSDSFSALLGDRLLAGEIGDDPELPINATAADLAQRIAERFGPPRFGVLSVTARASSQGEGLLSIRETVDLDEGVPL